MSPILCGMMLLVLQEDAPRAELRSERSRDSGGRWNLELEWGVGYPDQAVLSAQAVPLRHRYLWLEDLLEVETGEGGEAILPVREMAQAGKLRIAALPVFSPGLIELHFWFDPAEQVFPGVVRGLGRHGAVRHAYPVRRIQIAPVSHILDAIQKDYRETGRLVRRARELLDRIDRESSDPRWKEKSEALLAEIDKLRQEVEISPERTLAAAAFQVLRDALSDLEVLRSAIERLREEEAEGGAAAESGEGADATTFHPKEASDDPIPGTIFGKRLTVSRMRELLDRADQLQLREFFSWIVLLCEEMSARATEAYERGKARRSDEALRRAADASWRDGKLLSETLESLSSEEGGRETAARLLRLGEGPAAGRFEDFFPALQRYVVRLTDDVTSATPTPEDILDLRSSLAELLSAARKNARGGKEE